MESSEQHNSDLTRIQTLPIESAFAFMLSCAERMYPNYVYFTQYHGWGDPQTIRETLDVGWKWLAGQQLDLREAERIKQKCQEAEPDTEQFDSPYVSPALDAAAIAGLILDFIDRPNHALAADAASLCIDTVDMYVQEVERLPEGDPNLEERIQRHPLMQRELARQRRDIDALCAATDSIDLSGLEAKWRNACRSSIDLS